MRLTFVITAALVAATTAAAAHDVRRSDGTAWEHDCDGPFFAEAKVRNVSVTVPQLFACEDAAWPDIPVSCLADAPMQTASAD